MQESDEVEKRLSELVMLDLSDEQFRLEAEEIFELLSERDRQISETFDELLEEIDDLIILAERLEKENVLPR
jgi:hypothetical protein